VSEEPDLCAHWAEYETCGPECMANDAGVVALLERGRRLASQRDDLIAAGVDPADLAVPLAPTPAPTRETT
jgi:hypothetical protein